MNRSPRHVDFGVAIRTLRTERAMSQTELGAASGLHRTYVGGIERGERNPSLTNIFRIADALGVEPSALLAAAERTPEGPAGP